MKKVLIWTAGLLLGSGSLFSQNLVGQWTFDNPSEPYAATIGNPLVPKVFKTNTMSDIATAGITETDGARKLAKFTYYDCNHGIAANGGGTRVNNYSILYDIKINSFTDWHCLLQSNSKNDDDGDVFIRNKDGAIGCGTMGYSTTGVSKEKWMRIVVTMKLGAERTPPAIYIDGELYYTGTSSKSGNYVLDSKHFSLSLDKILIFGDDGADMGETEVSQLGIWDGTLTSAQVKKLGKAGDALDTSIETSPLVEIANWQFNDATNPLKATLGKDLTVSGTYKTVEGSATGKKAVELAPENYLAADLSEVLANGSGSKINDWTVLMDVKRPLKADGKGYYSSLLQTNANNTDDGDVFVDKDGRIGNSKSKYTPYGMSPEEWYRVVINYQSSLGKYSYYIDGQVAKSGETSAIALDGRWSLDNKLLFAADNDGEDGTIQIGQIRLWTGSLPEAKIEEFGGFGHQMPKAILYMHPFMYDPCATEATISWHDSKTDVGSLAYGTTKENLGKTVSSTSQIIKAPYIWHTAQLTGLTPNTNYFYQLTGTKGKSEIFSFKTLPADKDVETIRFLLVGDTHNNPAMSTRILDKAKATVESVYGKPIQDCIQFTMHTGDVVNDGGTESEYSDMLFNPFKLLSPSIPILITAGNHEKENNYFYQYVNNENISAEKDSNAKDFERYWSKKIGNTLFVGLNSYSNNFSAIAQTTAPDLDKRQIAWLTSTLDAAEKDNSIAMVFCFVHECPLGELWGTSGEGCHVKPDIYPLIRKYPKVQQLAYGHTHGYERGISRPLTDESLRDISLVCDGGAGGNIDRWGKSGLSQIDQPEISISLDHYFFIVGEINTKDKSYSFKNYSLGNHDKWLSAEVVDQWSGNMDVTRPSKPTTISGTLTNRTINLEASAFKGKNGIYSSQMQLIRKSNSGTTTSKIFDITRDSQNIYNVDDKFNPIDKNKGINLCTIERTGVDEFTSSHYEWRVRYRDNNRVWSEWSDYATISDATSIQSQSENKTGIIVLAEHQSKQFGFILPQTEGLSEVRIFNVEGKQIFMQTTSQSNLQFSGSTLPQGRYIISVKQGSKTYKESFML